MLRLDSVQAVREPHLQRSGLGREMRRAAMPGGGRGVSWLLLPPKPDKPLKNHCKQAVQRWSSGQAQDRRFLGMDGRSVLLWRRRFSGIAVDGGIWCGGTFDTCVAVVWICKWMAADRLDSIATWKYLARGVCGRSGRCHGRQTRAVRQRPPWVLGGIVGLFERLMDLLLDTGSKSLKIRSLRSVFSTW